MPGPDCESCKESCSQGKKCGSECKCGADCKCGSETSESKPCCKGGEAPQDCPCKPADSCNNCPCGKQ